MLSRSRKFIFIHVPKTGGTTIHRVLLEHSEDRTWKAPYQDGIDSFEIRGPITEEKHSDLQFYHDRLGDEFHEYRIIVSVRHPFPRIISAIYSPHKWARQSEQGEWYSEIPYWEEGLLEKILKATNLKSAVEYLKVGGRIIKPDYVIRAESLEKDLVAACEDLGLSLPSPIPIANRSAARVSLRQALLTNPELRNRIEAIYSDDIQYFGYASYPC